MSRQTRTSVAGTRWVGRVVPVAAVFALLLAGRAQAQTQVSGSMPIQPDVGQLSPTDVLVPNEAVSMEVFICNTSTLNGLAADVKVTGTTRVALSCVDANCIAQTQIGPPVNERAALTFDSCTPESDVVGCNVHIAPDFDD